MSGLAPALPDPLPDATPAEGAAVRGEPSFASAVADLIAVLPHEAAPWFPLALDYWQESNPEGVTTTLLELVRALRDWEEQTTDGVSPPLHLLWQIVLLCGVGVLFLQQQEPPEETFADAPLLLSHLEPVLADCSALMLRKNHDYGDSWRYMRLPGLTDQLLVKCLRLIQLEELEARGESGLVAEGRETEYRDILNYALLELLRYTTLADPLPWPVRRHSQPLIPPVRG